MWADQAIEWLLQKRAGGVLRFDTVLDVGAGPGEHANLFHLADCQVTKTDLATDGDYLTQNFGRQFDLVWCSHVLEHQPNVGAFLAKVVADCRDDGWIAITVPPSKPQIVGGHVSLWNAGLLLYRLALAGLDCRGAHVKTYGYNVSVIVRKKTAPLPPLAWDSGDITRLHTHLPHWCVEGFNGDIAEWNW